MRLFLGSVSSHQGPLSKHRFRTKNIKHRSVFNVGRGYNSLNPERKLVDVLVLWVVWDEEENARRQARRRQPTPSPTHAAANPHAICVVDVGHHALSMQRSHKSAHSLQSACVLSITWACAPAQPFPISARVLEAEQCLAASLATSCRLALERVTRAGGCIHPTPQPTPPPATFWILASFFRVRHARRKLVCRPDT